MVMAVQRVLTLTSSICATWNVREKMHLNWKSLHPLESESESEVTQSCPILWGPVDCSLPSSSVHGIFQATVLEWVAISFSRGSSWPRVRTWVSCIVGRCFTVWATGEVPTPSTYHLFIAAKCLHSNQDILFNLSVLSPDLKNIFPCVWTLSQTRTDINFQLHRKARSSLKYCFSQYCFMSLFHMINIFSLYVYLWPYTHVLSYI